MGEEQKNKLSVEERISLGLAALHARSKIEPYLREGFVYFRNNGHHAIAKYLLPHPDEPMEEGIDPAFFIIGHDGYACLEETAKSMAMSRHQRKTWQIYPLTSQDLEGADNYIKQGISSSQGINLQFIPAPVLYFAEAGHKTTPEEHAPENKENTPAEPAEIAPPKIASYI